jgi:hypothetical protein
VGVRSAESVLVFQRQVPGRRVVLFFWENATRVRDGRVGLLSFFGAESCLRQAPEAPANMSSAYLLGLDASLHPTTGVGERVAGRAA